MSLESATSYGKSVVEQITERVEAGAPFGHIDSDGYYHDIDECELGEPCEPATAYDYLEEVLDINYLIDSSKKYLAGLVLISFGGPTARINTFTRELECSWWSETVRLELPSEFCGELDLALEELFLS